MQLSEQPITPTGHGLIIGPPDAPLVTVTPLAEGAPEAAPLALPPEAAATVAGILQLLPAAAHASGPGAYLLRFAPHVSAQLATGQAALMQAVEGGARAIAVDAHGRIVGHGTLVPVAGVSPALAAAALWQVAAVATAQHYLVAMQRRLAQVHAAIDDLGRRISDREVAGLTTSARYLQDLMAARPGHPPAALPDHAAHQVEAIIREAALAVEARRMALARAAEEARSMPLSDPIWWNVERNVAALRDRLATADADLQVGALGLAVWAAAAAARREAGAPAPVGLRTLAEARAQFAEAHRLVGDLARHRADTITAPSDVRRALPSLQAQLRVEAEAAAHMRSAALQPIDDALAMLGDGPGPASPGLVARRAADGAWSLTAYRQAAPAPPDAVAILGAIRRLTAVPGLILAGLGDAKHARRHLAFGGGLGLSVWRNPVGVIHVFVVDRLGRAVFGGFVPPWGRPAIEAALREIAGADRAGGDGAR